CVNRKFATPSRAPLNTATTTTELSTLSLHDALPIYRPRTRRRSCRRAPRTWSATSSGRGWPRRPCRCTASCRSQTGLRRDCENRSEEHTSELQSPYEPVCRLLLEKKTKPMQLRQSQD